MWKLHEFIAGLIYLKTRFGTGPSAQCWWFWDLFIRVWDLFISMIKWPEFNFSINFTPVSVIGKKFLPNGPFSAFFDDFEIFNGPFPIILHKLLWAIFQVNGTMAHGPLPSQSLLYLVEIFKTLLITDSSSNPQSKVHVHISKSPGLEFTRNSARILTFL